MVTLQIICCCLPVRTGPVPHPLGFSGSSRWFIISILLTTEPVFIIQRCMFWFHAWKMKPRYHCWKCFCITPSLPLFEIWKNEEECSLDAIPAWLLLVVVSQCIYCTCFTSCFWLVVSLGIFSLKYFCHCTWHLRGAVINSFQACGSF